MAGRGLRIRALLQSRFEIVVVVLLLIGVIGGVGTYVAYANPGTVTQQRPGPAWHTSGWYNHSATVTEPNGVYPVGTQLADRPIYFATISPRMDGTYTFTYGADGGGDLNATVTVLLDLRGVDSSRGNTTVLWETTREIRNASFADVAPGETVHVPFTVDVNRTVNRTRAIDRELGNPPGHPQVDVVANVHLQGTVNDHRIDRLQRYSLPVVLQGRAYLPGHPGKTTDRYASTRTVVVPETYGPLRTVGAPSLLGLSVVALLGLVVSRGTGRLELTPDQRDRLAYEDDRSDFDEWISRVKLPEEAFALPRAEAASLADLVDVAIDAGTGVIEDPDGDAYYVVHDGFLYTYRPPTVGTEAE